MKGINARLLIAFYFFNMIVFTNGSIISKAGKLVFVGLSFIYIIKYNVTLKWKSYYAWMVSFLLISGVSIFWAESTSFVISGINTIALNFLCIFMLTQLFVKINDWDLVVSKSVLILPSIMFVRLFIQFGTAIFDGLRNIQNGNHNSAGMYAAWGVVFGIYYIVRTQSKKITYKFLILLNLGGCIISMSRKAILYLVLPLVIIYILMGENVLKRARNIFLLVLAAICGYLAVINIPMLYEYIGKGIESMLRFFAQGKGDISAAGRRTRINFGLKHFYQKPWFGWGTMNYNYLFGNYETSTAMVIADNNFIDLLVNVGIIGTVIYYFIYLKTIIMYFSIKSKKTLSVIMPFAVLLTLLACDYGVSSYLYLYSQTFIAVAVCMMLECYNSECKHNKIALE